MVDKLLEWLRKRLKEMLKTCEDDEYIEETVQKIQDVRSWGFNSVLVMVSIMSLVMSAISTYLSQIQGRIPPEITTQVLIVIVIFIMLITIITILIIIHVFNARKKCYDRLRYLLSQSKR